MSEQSTGRALAEHRQELVQQAEKRISDIFQKPRGSNEWPSRTQLSHLALACQDSACAEEIENYLRYQAARGRGDGLRQADDIIKGIESVKKKLPNPKDQVVAWQLYATYLARAFTYQEKAQQGGAR